MPAYKSSSKQSGPCYAPRPILAVGIFCLMVGANAAPGFAVEIMLVPVDQAKILRLDRPAGTIVIGNPMIADAAVQSERMVVITGKSFGTTNLIILDRDGEEILSTNLEVRYTASSQLTIQRGSSRFSYSCSPSCEPTLSIGDNVDQFKAIKDAITGRIEIATGQTASQ